MDSNNYSKNLIVLINIGQNHNAGSHYTLSSPVYRTFFALKVILEMARRSLDAPRRAIPVFRGGYLHYRRVFSNIISGAVVVVIIKFVP